MNVSSTALPLNCDRLTSWPVESRSVKSGAGAAGSRVAGAASFPNLADAAVALEDFDEPPQPASAAQATAIAVAAAAPRERRCCPRREPLRTRGTLAGAWRRRAGSLLGPLMDS